MAADRSRKIGWTGLMFCCLFSAAAQGQKLTFSSFEGSPAQEMSALIVAEAYASLGIEIEVQRFPGLRSVKTANEGLVDGELSRVKAFLRDNPNLIAVSVPVNYLKGTAFSKRDGIELKDWDSLEGFAIGIARGMRFAERGTAGKKVVVADSHRQLFQMLDRGRIDVAINPRINGTALIAEMGLEGIRAHEPPLIHIDLYHFLHKRNASLVPKITEVIRDMKASGRIDEIRNQFFRDLTVRIGSAN